MGIYFNCKNLYNWKNDKWLVRKLVWLAACKGMTVVGYVPR